MSDMLNNSEVLKFEPSQESNPMHYGEVIDDGSSARVLEPIDNGDEFSKESSVNAEIGELKHEIADTGKLSVVDPVKENIIFEPIKDLYIKPSFAKRVAKFIRRAGLKIGTMFLASATLSSAAACGPVEAAASSPEPVTITATQPVEVHVGDATVNTSNNNQNSEIVEETPSPNPTEAPTPTPTSEPTSTPNEATPKPTPMTIESTPMILKGKDKVEADVNQRFQDYLNGVGEFTDEKIEKEAFISTLTEVGDLGCLSFDEWHLNFQIQGTILCYEKIESGEVFAFGTKNKDGKRIITVVEFPSQSFIDNNNVAYCPIYSDNVYSNGVVREFIRRDNLYYNLLNSSIGNFFIFNLGTSPISGNPLYSGYPDGYVQACIESIDPKIAANHALMTNINIIDDRYHDFVKNYELVKQFYDSNPQPILTVETYGEFLDFIKNNYDQIPCSEQFNFMDIY